MNYLYLIGGGVLCLSIATLLGLTSATSPSPYIAAGLVLISMGFAVKNK